MGLNIAAIRARADAATPGPWVAIREDAFDTTYWITTPDVGIAEMSNASRPGENANFIVHARQDVPMLCDEVERLYELLSEATKCEQSQS
jgi:hypothetical protein